MPVSYDSSQLLKCTVSFNYSRYVIGGGEILNSKIPNSSALRGVTDEQILDAMSFATSPTQESLEANYYNTVYGES